MVGGQAYLLNDGRPQWPAVVSFFAAERRTVDAASLSPDAVALVVCNPVAGDAARTRRACARWVVRVAVVAVGGTPLVGWDMTMGLDAGESGMAALLAAAVREGRLRQLAASSLEREARAARAWARVQEDAAEIADMHQDLRTRHDRALRLLAHDLRTPIAVVLGNVELVESGFLDAAGVAAALAAVRRQAERIDEMVHHASAELRRPDHAPVPADRARIAELVTSVLLVAAPAMERRGQRIELQGALPELEVDGRLLPRLLLRLLEGVGGESPPGARVSLRCALEGAACRLEIRGSEAAPLEGVPLHCGPLLRALGAEAELLASGPASGSGVVVRVPHATRRAVVIGTGAADIDAATFGPGWQVVERRSAGEAGGALGGVPALVVVDADAISDAHAVEAAASALGVPVLAVGSAPDVDLVRPFSAGALHNARDEVVRAHAPAAPGPLSLWTSDPAVEPAPGVVVSLRISNLAELVEQGGAEAAVVADRWLAYLARDQVGAADGVARIAQGELSVTLSGRTPDAAGGWAQQVADRAIRDCPRLGLNRLAIRVEIGIGGVKRRAHR